MSGVCFFESCIFLFLQLVFRNSIGCASHECDCRCILFFFLATPLVVVRMSFLVVLSKNNESCGHKTKKGFRKGVVFLSLTAGAFWVFIS